MLANYDHRNLVKKRQITDHKEFSENAQILSYVGKTLPFQLPLTYLVFFYTPWNHQTTYQTTICFTDIFKGYRKRSVLCNGLTLSFTMLRNGQTYFKNLAVWNTANFLKYVWTFFNIMNERVNIDTKKTLKLLEIPRQKHLVYIFSKVSPEKISCKAQGSKQIYRVELLHRHPKLNIVFAETTVPLRVENDKLYFYLFCHSRFFQDKNWSP